MITRDSAILLLGVLGSLIGYFIAAEQPPTLWTYQQWLQFGAACIGIILSWLRSSPLAGVGEASKPVMGVFNKKV